MNPSVHTHAGPDQGLGLTLRLTSAACAECGELQVVAKKLSMWEWMCDNSIASDITS